MNEYPSLYMKHIILDKKNESIMAVLLKDAKKIKNDIDKIKMNQKNKRKNNIINNVITRNYLIAMVIKFIMMDILYKIKSNIQFDLFLFQYSSKISLKIKGIGDIDILGSSINNRFKSINYLKEVKINGKIQDIIKYRYYFNQTDNLVELIWDDNINDCYNMFSFCSKITEINLSNFDTSKVTDMGLMFYYCSSLTSLDLSNLNTSQVTNMGAMFYYCSLLSSLDLSNFETSQVTNMVTMFHDCK